MRDQDLERILKSARVPEREPVYWDGFASRVTRQLAKEPSRKAAPRPKWQLSTSGLTWGTGLAAACIIAAFAIGFWKARETGQDTQLGAMQKYYREVAALFPNQLQAVILDDKGPHLLLADTADVARSAPIFLKICLAKGCQRFITFSGQQIPVNGEECDVLADAQGNIIIAGRKLIWSSAQPLASKSANRIQARFLETSL